MSSAVAHGATARSGTAELAVRGMTCASCAARVEQKLNAIEGVTARVNLATERATVTMPAATQVEDLVAVIKRAGYDAEPVSRFPATETADPDSPAGAGKAAAPSADASAARYLLRRLLVAVIFCIPLTDLSVLLSLFPADRFPGWQWVLTGIAAPVVLWAAWPFHRAALRNARHGTCTMDTLVSLSVVTASGWSLYAMFALDQARVTASPYYELFHAAGGGIYLEVAASVVTFLLAGRFYEARARRTASEAMRELAR